MGVNEVRNQVNVWSNPSDPRHTNRHDGHNNMPAKLLEFILWFAAHTAVNVD